VKFKLFQVCKVCKVYKEKQRAFHRERQRKSRETQRRNSEKVKKRNRKIFYVISTVEGWDFLIGGGDYCLKTFFLRFGSFGAHNQAG
jgi:hypothetical protein